MNRHIRIFTFTLAVLLAAPIAAQAAVVTKPGPGMSGPGPATTSSSGEIASPGDRFLPDKPNGSQPPKDYAPWKATCVYGGMAEAGKFWIGFKNTGTTTIPKGTVLLIDAPYGTYKVKTIDELEPGETYDFAYFDKNPGPIDCDIDFTPSPADYPPEGPR